MYHHLSRMLYRQLAPMLRHGSDRQRLLDACEATMQRLATDPDYFAKPERFLFGEVRPLFGLGDQLQVRLIIDLEVATARRALEHIRTFERRGCAAFTRSGEPCRREPSEAGRYCPSHRHLDEAFEPSLVAA
jgi:hypothetical protein